MICNRRHVYLALRRKGLLIDLTDVWRYIPAKIQTLACNIVALNYCSFSHSNIHLLQFNIVHSQFKVHISNATSLGMRHSYSMFNVFIRCTMRYASNAIQHPCFLHFQTISIVCSQVSSFDMQHSCLSMQFWSSAVQSAICLIHNPILYFGHWTSRSSDLTLTG